MVGYIGSRLLQAIPVLLVVGFIAFALFAYVGDPVSILLPQDHTEAQRLQLVKDLGLDQPFFVQYAHFLWLLSRLFMMISLTGVSLPTFLLGILLILIFSVWLGWLPSFGRGTVVQLGHWWSTGFVTASGLKSLILPAITLGLFQMTLIMRLVRAEMLEVLRTDYIKFARARGLTNRAIHFGHALKNTLVPVITIIGLQFGGIVAFSLVTETVFQWPGMGLLLVQSVTSADIPVMSAYLMLIALVFVVINLVVDLLYYAIDPRLRVRRR
jgi:peptide/nickel transport system permease protein